MNYTHVVWSYVHGTDGDTVDPMYTNSWEQHYLVQDGTGEVYSIDSGIQIRIGLPTITTFPDQEDPGTLVGTIQYIKQDLLSGHYPVYSKDFWYYNGDIDERPETDSTVQISAGYSEDDAPYTYGPTSALQGYTELLCAWTEFDSYNPPDIYGDEY